ncbi:MAG TPA: M23 family metallopeptidase [Terriglobia bacterium]|nr:M23 family metallopeptidase [Terriglobia bacterium]
MHLVYELHLTNFSSQDCALTGVEVLRSDGDYRVLAQYEGADLVGSIARPGAQQLAGTDKLSLGPGLSGIVYLWVTVATEAEVPAAIEHRVSVKVADSAFSAQCARVAVKRGVAVIGPPLRGSDWMAANGPSNTSAHRRALIPIDGRARISQRFAIDWVELRDDGNTFAGDPKDNRNYRAYGSEVLAVADGTVSEVKDGIPQNVPGEDSRAVAITLETIGGNHIILDLGGGRYAFYAHLQPGSLRVKLGDHVSRGQVLGLVGNSGNSTEPHLHFQLCDANSPLGSEGLPYALDSFEVEGMGTDWKGAKSEPQKREREIPAENEVVRFPSGY